MRFRRDLIVAVLATFCLTSTLLMVVPTRSNPTGGSSKYDPWADLNCDGTIDIFDAINFAGHFGSSGIPLNKSRWYYANWFDALVGYWKFDEGTGNVTVDASGHSNNGALVNDPAWVDGKYGKALSFNGTNYVSIADSQSLQVQSFTLEAWIYMTQRPYTMGVEASIIDKSGFDPEWFALGFALRFGFPNSTDDHLDVLFGGVLSGLIILLQYNSINDLTLNQWHQVVVTFECFRQYPQDTIALYIDGILRKTETYSFPYEPVYWPQSFPVLLGSGGFKGSIDNVMIYERPLSAEEVMYHYVLPPP